MLVPMFKILEKTRLTIQHYDLLRPNDNVLIALSGGPDSVAMFHILNLLAPEYDLNISAVHINHQLRKEADTDQLFCRQLCKAYRCKFHSRKVDISKLAKRLKIGTEQAGREYRYGYFRSLCEKYGYNKIATGHTADDSAETFILNLIRGADLGGLRGIPSKRDNIIRPLIDFPKNELLVFLRENRLSYRIDKSNQGLDYNRNVVRNIIIPAMAKINPAVSDHINKSSSSINKNYEFIMAETEKAYQTCLVSKSKRQIVLDLKKLPVYYESLECWVLLVAYSQLTESFTRPGANKLESVLRLTRNGSVAFLGDGVVVCYHDNKLILSKPSSPLKRIKLKRNSINKLTRTEWRIKTEISERYELEAIKINRDESIAYLDDELLGELEVRSPEKGDKFKPLGFRGTKKLADYLNDKNVPHINKQSVPVIVSDGKIVWVAGFGISDDCKVTGTTKRVLKLQLING